MGYSKSNISKTKYLEKNIIREKNLRIPFKLNMPLKIL